MKIVFVHFGSSIPTYLKNNIRRVLDYFPDYELTLLTDSAIEIPELDAVVNVSQISQDSRYSRINEGLNHPKEFRNNFWFTSLARIVAICDYSIATGENLLHIESDVLLAKDFPLELFKTIDRPISYTILGERRAVASTFFLKSGGAARLLLKFIEDSVHDNPNTTDMKILGDFQQEFPGVVRVLASFPPEATISFSKLPDSLQDDFIYSLKLFGGYFDAADIGQYLLGDDPRNHRGVKYMRKELETSFFKPSTVQFEFNENREFIDVQGSVGRKVYSLHIHSKDLATFKRRSTNRRLRKSVLSQNQPESHKFLIRVFVTSVKYSILRRSKAFARRLRGE